ncbi:hypothetical protein RAS2_27920 [Phycisphaerae bacterium RAS2]|nr:hypothetical protein RAS2_27920 [Phycisphaerae bacterium RAS2]
MKKRKPRIPKPKRQLRLKAADISLDDLLRGAMQAGAQQPKKPKRRPPGDTKKPRKQ